MKINKLQLLILLLSFSAGLNAQNKNANAGQMVTICHQTGNGGSQTITININALQAHLNHGDVLGACVITKQPTDSNPTENDDSNDDAEEHDNDDDSNDDGEENDNNDDSNDDGEENDNDDDSDDDGEENDNDDDSNDDGEENDNDDDSNDDGEENDNDDDSNDDGEENDNDDDSNNDGDDDDQAEGNDDGDDDDDTIAPPETPSPAQGCNAVEVMSYIPGTTNDLLTPISPARQILTNVLGSPQESDVATPASAYNFVALGFGGQITLKFANPIHNGAGDDLYVVETTFGTNSGNCARYPEKIRAFASQDNCNWVYLGEGCQNSYFDLQGLAWAQYVKLIDMSNITANFGGMADGYDLDGIVCLNGEEANPTLSTASADYATEAMDYLPGTLKNGGSIPAARSIKENAVGAPQNTDVVNFVALGFGGKITLKFAYVVFDKAGDDLMLVETSFGNPSCENYPETARLEVSLDNINWFMLSETYCLDQAIDIAGSGATMFHYLRISDASQMSSSRFPGTADGFDVDGVIVTQPGCTSTPAARLAAELGNDNTQIANEIAEVSVFPNPFTETQSIKLSTSNTDETFEVSIINTLGQIISSEMIEVASSSTVNHTLPVAVLAKGSYLISIRSANTNQVVRTVKL
jgi:segregation and condensation protein B